MTDRVTLCAQIEFAFSDVEPPPPWALSKSREGTEPQLLEQDFQDKIDWRTLTPEFLDQTPGGYSSALSFFSDEAFRYFIPAYMLAAIKGQLERVDPTFYLCHGLDDATRTKKVNPKRFGDRTWWDESCYRFSVFSRLQCAAIVGYLLEDAARDECKHDGIRQVLANYWSERAR